eukprot:IDg9997t1
MRLPSIIFDLRCAFTANNRTSGRNVQILKRIEPDQVFDTLIHQPDSSEVKSVLEFI